MKKYEESLQLAAYLQKVCLGLETTEKIFIEVDTKNRTVDVKFNSYECGDMDIKVRDKNRVRSIENSIYNVFKEEKNNATKDVVYLYSKEIGCGDVDI